MQKLTSKERAFLRKYAHHLKPTVQIGAQGIHKNVLETIRERLRVDELIKIKVHRDDIYDKESLQEHIDQILKEIDIEIVGVIGTTLIVFQEQSDVEKRHFDIKKMKVVQHISK